MFYTIYVQILKQDKLLRINLLIFTETPLTYELAAAFLLLRDINLT